MLTYGLLTTEKSGEPAGIAWYVVGLAMGQLGEDSLKVGQALERASTMLGDTEDRLDNRMANRALAARVLFGSENLAVKRAAVLSVQDIQDPGIYVYLGQHEERLGNMGRAREYLDESVQMGPEYALAHFAKGHFYYQQVHDDAEALRSWAAYLDLNPSGKRAARMRERLGR